MAYLPPSIVEKNNTTNQPLGSGKVFTGKWADVIDFTEVIVTALSSSASATNGLDIQWSPDGNTVVAHNYYTLSASFPFTANLPCQSKYMRIVYTNGGSSQSSFSLQTLLKKYSSTPVKQNAELGLSYDANGNLIGLSMTTDAGVYNKTLTWTSGNLVNISKWS